MAESKTLKFGTAGLAHVENARRTSLGWLKSGADAFDDVRSGLLLKRALIGEIQSDLVLKHARIKNDSSSSLETFPDHPPKGNAGKTMTFCILHRSTTDIWNDSCK